LALSIDQGAVRYRSDTSVALHSQEFLFSFRTLCDKYKAAGGTPLRLQKLHLELSMLLTNPGTDLTGLTDLAYLEDMYLSNKEASSYNNLFPIDNLAWKLFVPERCPRLRKFGTYATSHDVDLWFQNLPAGYIRQFSALAIKNCAFRDVSWGRHPVDGPGISAMSLLLGAWDDAHELRDLKLRRLEALVVYIDHIRNMEDLEEAVSEYMDVLVEELERAPELQQLYIGKDSYEVTYADADIQHEYDFFGYKVARQVRNCGISDYGNMLGGFGVLTKRARKMRSGSRGWTGLTREKWKDLMQQYVISSSMALLASNDGTTLRC
jgi:hypothetical protein